MKKNNRKDFWKTKTGHALIDVGIWFLVYGVSTLVFSGVSLVYLEIYSLTTEITPDYIGNTFLELYLGCILIASFYFIHHGSMILRKKVLAEKAHKESIIPTLLLLLALIPLDWAIYVYKGFNVIFVLYLILAVINIITIISLVRYQHRRIRAL